MKKWKYLLGVLAMLAVSLSARAEGEATIPSVSDMVTQITSIGGLAAAAAAIGLPIWLYLRARKKAGQALS